MFPAALFHASVLTRVRWVAPHAHARTGLHPLTPYLVKFIADEVAASLHHTRSLALLLRLARSLVRNEHLGLDRYLHQLLPALLTCVVAAGIGERIGGLGLAHPARVGDECVPRRARHAFGGVRAVAGAGSAGAAPGGVDAWGIRQDAAQLVAEVSVRMPPRLAVPPGCALHTPRARTVRPCAWRGAVCVCAWRAGVRAVRRRAPQRAAARVQDAHARAARPHQATHLALRCARAPCPRAIPHLTRALQLSSAA